jgi:hypothetical protein
MVYDVQNYEVYFGLYPSSGIYTHLRTETDPVSETLWFFCHIYQTMDKVQNKSHSSVNDISVK